MKLGTFMVIALIFALSLILAPSQLLAMYGETLDVPWQWLARYLGSAFIGIGVVSWFARNTAFNGAMRAIILGFFVLAITGLVVALLYLTYATGNVLSWLTIAVYVFLTLGFGYFQFSKLESA